MQVAIRCRYCGARETLSETVLQSLRGGRVLVRTCSECRAGTPWDVQSTPVGTLAATGLEDGEQPGLASPRETPRILVIDDDTEILTIVSKALSREDVDLETVSSGRDALNRLTREDFDLILSDVRMPEFDGKQLFRFLEEHMPELRDKVIFLTGDLGTQSTIEFFHEVGAPYLPKPLDLGLLAKMIRDRLGLAAGRPASSGAAAWRKE